MSRSERLQAILDVYGAEDKEITLSTGEVIINWYSIDYATVEELLKDVDEKDIESIYDQSESDINQ
jgi:hypothetical protein